MRKTMTAWLARLALGTLLGLAGLPGCSQGNGNTTPPPPGQPSKGTDESKRIQHAPGTTPPTPGSRPPKASRNRGFRH